LRLLLLRHAKSDWSDGGKRDEDRPLSSRGRKAAACMAAHMRRSGYVPAAILCSTARRTRETLALVLPALGRQPDIRYEDALYLAEWGALLKAIQRSADAVSPLLLVGHNPGLEQLAAALAAQPASRSEGERLERLTGKFPTAALAVLDFEAKRWRDIRRATGRLTDFVCPKDLTGADGDG
jgi:phosphohistidine phosphatase